MKNNMLGKLTQCGDEGFLDDGEDFIHRKHLTFISTLPTTDDNEINQVISCIKGHIYVHKKPDEEKTELYSPNPEFVSIRASEEN